MTERTNAERRLSVGKHQSKLYNTVKVIPRKSAMSWIAYLIFRRRVFEMERTT